MAEDSQGIKTSAQPMVQSARSVVLQIILEKKCRTKETKQPRTGKRLHLVEIEDDTEDEFAIDMVAHKIGSLNTKSNDDVATQLFVTMIVNDNANIKFQLDCGATCNLLPLKDYARVM